MLIVDALIAAASCVAVVSLAVRPFDGYRYLTRVLRPSTTAAGGAPQRNHLLPFIVRSMYDTSQQPRGFVFKLRLYSTVNDPYYVGLDGIQFYALANSGDTNAAAAAANELDSLLRTTTKAEAGGRGGGGERGRERQRQGRKHLHLRRTLQRLEAAYRSCLVPVWPEVVEANPRDINILDRRANIDPIDQVRPPPRCPPCHVVMSVPGGADG